MLVVLTCIAHDYSLLPYFLKHYRNLGVEKFYFAILPNALQKESLEKILNILKKEKDVEAQIVSSSKGVVGSVGVNGAVTEYLRSQLFTKEHWLIPADLDEFNEYPGDLKEIIKKMEKENYTHVQGCFVDRSAGGKKLPPVLPIENGVSIFDQFPSEEPLTEKIGGGYLGKVLLSRGDLPLATGHHFLYIEKTKPYPFSGKVYHFKWIKGLVETLKKRIESEKKENLPYFVESERIVKYFSENDE